MSCAKCGEMVRGFQTNGGGAGMHVVEIDAVTTMYAACICGYWVGWLARSSLIGCCQSNLTVTQDPTRGHA